MDTRVAWNTGARGWPPGARASRLVVRVASEVFVEGDGRRWVFNGEGGGAPGGGGYSGKLFTSSLDRLVSSTTSCALVAATFYGTVAFFDANANVLGNFHGGGFGVGGGGYTGHWE